MNREQVIAFLKDLFYWPMVAVGELLWEKLIVAVAYGLYYGLCAVYGFVMCGVFLVALAFYWAVMFCIFAFALDQFYPPQYDRLILFGTLPLGIYATLVAFIAIHRRRYYDWLYQNIVAAASQLRPTSYSSKRAKINARRQRV